jgi:O-antigen/teichoic acid export membrane protein
MPFFIGKVLKNSAITLVGSVLSQLLIVLFNSILASKLSNSEFASITFLLTTVQLFAILSSGGIGLAVVKFISEKKDPVNEKDVIQISSYLNLIFSVFSITILFIFQGEFGIKLTENTIILLVAGVISISADALLKSILIGKQQFLKLTFITLINSFIIFSLNVAGFNLFGVDYLYETITVSYIIGLLFSILFLKKYITKFSFSFVKMLKSKKAKEILRFTFPLLFANLIVIFTNWFIQFDLSKKNNLSELALLGVINQLINLFLFIPVIFGKALMPVISENIASKLFVKSRQILIGSTIGILLTFVTIWFCQEVILTIFKFLFSSKYSLTNYYWLIITLAFFASVSSLIGNFIAASAKMFFGLILNFIWSIIVFTIYFSFGNNGSIEYILYSLIWGYGLNFILGLLYVLVILNDKAIFKNFLMAFINLTSPKVFVRFNDKVNRQGKSIVFILIDYDKFFERDFKSVGNIKYHCGQDTLNYTESFCLKNNIDYYRIITTDNKEKISTSIYRNARSYILNKGTDIAVLKDISAILSNYQNIAVINSSCAYEDILELSNLYAIAKESYFSSCSPYILGFNANSKISPTFPKVRTRNPHIITNAFITKSSLVIETISHESKRKYLNTIFHGFNDKFYAIRFFEIYISKLILSTENGDLLVLLNNELISYKKNSEKWPLMDSRLNKFFKNYE